MLTLKDFKEENVHDEWYYYSTKKDGYELTIEPCMSGFDVALYFDQQLYTPKLCTSTKNPTEFGGRIESIQRALSYANDLWLERGSDEKI